MRWRLKSPASRLFSQPFIQTHIKENIKAPRHWPLCGEFTGDRWIPRTNGQKRGKCFHLMTSSWRQSHDWPSAEAFYHDIGKKIYRQLIRPLELGHTCWWSSHFRHQISSNNDIMKWVKVQFRGLKFYIEKRDITHKGGSYLPRIFTSSSSNWHTKSPRKKRVFTGTAILNALTKFHPNLHPPHPTSTYTHTHTHTLLQCPLYLFELPWTFWSVIFYLIQANHVENLYFSFLGKLIFNQILYWANQGTNNRHLSK